MSKIAKTAGSTPGSVNPAEPELPFEEALAKLETIVEGMEAADLPLEQLLAKFEEGAQLARICQTRLAAAEVRVRQLEKNLAGDWETRPIELTSPTETA